MKGIQMLWNMSSIILRLPSNFLRHAMANIFNLICRIWPHWIWSWKTVKTKETPAHTPSGLWENSLIRLTGAFLVKMKQTKHRPSKFPSFASLMISWTVRSHWSIRKTLVKQTLVYFLYLLQDLELWPALGLRQGGGREGERTGVSV